MERVLFAPRELPPLRANVAEALNPYDDWVREREKTRVEAASSARGARTLHVVMVIDGPPPSETIESIRSLSVQTSTSWKLSVIACRTWLPEIRSMVHSVGVDERSDVEAVDDRGGFVDLVGEEIVKERGGDLALIFPGDVWAPDTVSQLSAALPEEGVAYADEDCLTASGEHVLPRLKPEFSPEFLLHQNYVGRPLALSAGVLARLPQCSATTSETREHDLALRACDIAMSVRHVPEVLCHRRIGPEPVQAPTTGRLEHVAASLGRRGDDAAVAREGDYPGAIHIDRSPRPTTTASLIIPFRDEPRFLRACLDSVDRTTRNVVPEYVLIDNGSVQPETKTLLDRLVVRSDVRLLRDDRPFNWAALNNAAALEATGSVLVFMNNDIEALRAGWLDALCAQAGRPDVGAVGARLLYPDRRLQHCGVVLGLGGAAGHVLLGLGDREPGYLNMAITSRECSAVTGACLVTRREVFEDHGLFDESLGVDLNDIDYCLRVQRSGLRVLYEAGAELLHHESPSRGTAGGVADIVRFINRWKPSILSGDRYLNPHLTRVDSSCALRGPAEEEWWHQWYVGLSRS